MNSIARVSLITVLLGVGATAAAAQTYAPEPAGARAMSSDVILIDNKKHKWKKNHKHYQKWAYNEKYGRRYRHRRPGYLYFYDGWWYPRPYWNEPGISIHLGL